MAGINSVEMLRIMCYPTGDPPELGETSDDEALVYTRQIVSIQRKLSSHIAIPDDFGPAIVAATWLLPWFRFMEQVGQTASSQESLRRIGNQLSDENLQPAEEDRLKSYQYILDPQKGAHAALRVLEDLHALYPDASRA